MVVTRSPTPDVVKTLAAHMPVSFGITLLLAILFTVEQSKAIPEIKNLVITWFICFLIVQSLRLLLVHNSQIARFDEHEFARKWLYLFRIGLFLSAALWGIAGSILNPINDLAPQIFISLMIAGIASGAIVSLAVDRLSSLIFIFTAVTPHAVLHLSNEKTFTLGLLLAAYLFFICLVTIEQGKRLHENFDLKYKADISEYYLRQTLDASPAAAVIFDTQNREPLYANQRYYNLIHQLGCSDLIECLERHDDFENILLKIKRGEVLKERLMELQSQYSHEKVWALASFLKTNFHNKDGMLCWFYDISDRKKMEEKVQHQAHHDHLTGLPNRALFNDRLHHMIQHAERNNQLFALFFADLDGFKQVNDQYGHDVGDLLLCMVAKRINAALRKSDTVARLGGDEFAFIIADINGEQDAVEVANKLLREINKPYLINETILTISASFGIAMYPMHGISNDELLKHADMAMYQAKKTRQDNIQIFDDLSLIESI